ncbi:MAG: sigma-70 family RNA polymerase sigma factor [Oscillospiraceae bacterium]
MFVSVMSIPDYSLLSDEQLAGGGVTADSAERMAELISRYSNLIFSLAARYCASADYEELVSDGLDALLNAIASFDSTRGSFAPFASVCVENRIKNTVDKAARRAARLTDESALDTLQSPAPSPEELAILREDTYEMGRQMKLLLSPLERRCLDGVILGLSYAEIAQKLCCDKKTVDNAVARARAKLRARFPDF